MDSVISIKEKLSALAKNFPEVKFSYVYDKLYNQHIIVVNPETAYLSERFAKYQIQFETEIISTFPDQDIMFTSDVEGLDLPSYDLIIQPIPKQPSAVEIFHEAANISFREIKWNQNNKFQEYNIDALLSESLSQMQINEGLRELNLHLARPLISKNNDNPSGTVCFNRELLSAYPTNWTTEYKAAIEIKGSDKAPTILGEENSYAMAA